jgi:hypothetical protein
MVRVSLLLSSSGNIVDLRVGASRASAAARALVVMGLRGGIFAIADEAIANG